MTDKPSRPQVRIQEGLPDIVDVSDSDFKSERDQPPTSEDAKTRSKSKKNDDTDKKQPARRTITLPKSLQWIPANSTWPKWKPVIRSAIAAWISVVIFVIYRTEKLFGQAAFLVVLASFLSPPSDPFMSVLERELILLAFTALGWGWVCLGFMFANLARTHTVPSATLEAAITGQYIEAAPSVIILVFLFIGVVFFLYIKARLGPGPFLPASVFGCICLDLCFTTGSLFPYPYYKIGQTIILPLSFHAAVSLIVSIFVFPQSVSALFTSCLQGVFASLSTAISLHRSYLLEDVTSSEFSHSQIVDAVNKAESSMPILAAVARLLHIDIVYARFAPNDYGELHKIVRKLIMRANGLGVYYSFIDPTRERFPVTPATPYTTSPVESRSSSPQPDLRSPETPAEKHPSSTDRELGDGQPFHHNQQLSSRSQSYSASPISPRHPRRASRHSNSYQSQHTHLHSSLFHAPPSWVQKPSREAAVGVFESQRYVDLEATHLSHPASTWYTSKATELLSTSCQDLLSVCEEALVGSGVWLGKVCKYRFHFWRRDNQERVRICKEEIKKYEDLLERLTYELDEFTNKKRLSVLDPYRSIFESGYDASDDAAPPHRHLFHCYVYQFHLMRFATLLQDILKEIVRLETERGKPKLWLPPLPRLFTWTTWEATESLEHEDEENPEEIPGMNPVWMADLGEAVKRDPDALSPRNGFETAMNWIYRTVVSIGGGNTLFALKAGVLTVLLSLPYFFKSSAHFAYTNKFIWAVFMGQLTLARFRGDTAFGLVTRIISTFAGCVIALVMWYISAGDGRGNPYGLAAVCAVCFPFFFFVRLYWPIGMMTNLIIWVTVALVVGYSYQDTHLVLPSTPGWGFDAAWRRFVLVVVGVLAAGIFSFLPPSRTIRSYERRTLATTSSELGAIYCSIMSYANTHVEEEDNTIIIRSLLAIRSKLKRSLILKENVIYEFSLRGRWPAERYHKILEIQMQIGYLLSHLLSIVEHLEPAWAHAFLRRTRMLDSDFQGDVLAVICLISNSLHTGAPLPQITPCPLLDRFMLGGHGLNVVHKESEDDYGLPRTMSVETLENLQYLTFCVGVSTAFGIITRLDRLMIAVKEVVGEQYHIHGVGVGPPSHRRSMALETKSPALSIRATEV